MIPSSAPCRIGCWKKASDVRFATRVLDVDFDDTEGPRRATRLHIRDKSGDSVLDLGADDATLITLGSITADATYGGNDNRSRTHPRPPDGRLEPVGDPRRSVVISAARIHSSAISTKQMGKLYADLHGDTFLKRLVDYSGNQPGTGGLMTFFESAWLMSLVNPYQPIS